MSLFEWIAPAGPILGVGVGWGLNELSRRGQQRHATAMFEREQKAMRDSEQARRARDLAIQMLDNLRILRTDLPAVVSLRNSNRDRNRRARRGLDEIWRLAMIIPEPVLHERILLTHTILAWAEDIAHFGNVDFWPSQIVVIAASDAINLVGAYLRGEQVAMELDERMLGLQKGYEIALAERQSQEEEEERIWEEEHSGSGKDGDSDPAST